MRLVSLLLIPVKNDLNGNEKKNVKMEKGKSKVPEWKLARHGIEMLINNKTNEAHALFKQYPDSLQMYAGYSCMLFMVSHC